MNRRAFFAALAAIPTVAKWLKPKPKSVPLFGSLELHNQYLKPINPHPLKYAGSP